MKNSRSSSRPDTLIGKVFDRLPTFIVGLTVGSLITVYGTLTQVELLNYWDSEQNIFNFYQNILGFSKNPFSENKHQYRGYIEKVNISVNPNNLSIHVLPNSICELAILEGDRVQVQSPVEVIGKDNSDQDSNFNLFKQRITKIISDGFGYIEVVSPNNESALIEINLLTEQQSCVRKSKDVQELEKLLEQKKWKDADQKTYQVLLILTKRESIGFMNEEAIKKIPCSDLKTIDQLWKKYSGGLFGFSVQKRIFVETDNQLEPDAINRYDPNAYIHFVDLVRWIESGKNGKEEWKPYDQLNFSLEAPEGHLPRLPELAKGMEMQQNYQLISPNSLPLNSQQIKARTLFFSRAETCEL